ncbi:hypothetical protein B7494_g8156 [Chlorociboria aeruginascens]|nr:hypothetical protein B7494_g8156 [Chlorociboria aeruginascens]
MAGLVDYGSSEEDEEIQLQSPRAAAAKPSIPTNGIIDGPPTKDIAQSIGIKESQLEASAPIVGPVLGPLNPPDISMMESSEENEESTPNSPNHANRALQRDLTLPTVPNYDIPPSPPGSPLASTRTKFDHFLEQKQQGIHLNAKLSQSQQIKNPSLIQNLLDFAGIDEDGQYATTLPKELWDPCSFPEYAFKEELAKSQQEVLKRKEEEKSRGQREAVEFVPATISGDSSRSGTPGARIGQKSAAERIMAGLDRGRANSPHVQGVKRKARLES